LPKSFGEILHFSDFSAIREEKKKHKEKGKKERNKMVQIQI
jgi:hypothetical protein